MKSCARVAASARIIFTSKLSCKNYSASRGLMLLMRADKMDIFKTCYLPRITISLLLACTWSKLIDDSIIIPGLSHEDNKKVLSLSFSSSFSIFISLSLSPSLDLSFFLSLFILLSLSLSLYISFSLYFSYFLSLSIFMSLYLFCLFLSLLYISLSHFIFVLLSISLSFCLSISPYCTSYWCKYLYILYSDRLTLKVQSCIRTLQKIPLECQVYMNELTIRFLPLIFHPFNTVNLYEVSYYFYIF